MLNETEKKIRQIEEELQSYKRAVSELEVLNEIAVAAGRADTIDQTLKLILNRTTSFINAEHGVILLVSENDEILETYIKQAKNSQVKKRPRIGEHITGWVLSNKKSLIIKDLGEEQRFKTTEEEKANIKSLICSPIWFKGKIIGILQMINKKTDQGDKESFTDNDLSLLSIISVQAGQLIKNLKLQQLNFEKKHEAEMARLEADKLLELDRLKTNFFTNISHEFRTPLTLIIGPAEKINSQTSIDILKDSDTIKRNSMRLLNLVNQLLDLSKLEAGKLKLEASKGNIVSFIKGIALSFESLSLEKDITLKIFSEKDFIEVYFDREKMIKVLTNILSNAFKFTNEKGKVTITINTGITLSSSFSKELKEGFVEIKIRDTGIGIPKAEIPKIFNRFYQADSSLTKDYKGTGIGLALTKELVDLHHGKISIRSDEGRWTEFILNLPLGRNHLGDEEILPDKKGIKPISLMGKDDYYLPKNIKKLTVSDFEANPLKDEKTIILIVEDNYDMREYIKESLEGDYFIEEAVNGEQGLSKAENIIPDLIISDMMMPKMDGNELVKRIKNDERTSHIPVILLTAKSEQESKLAGLETGADDYLIKPFDIREMLVRIKNLINSRKILQDKYGKGDFFRRQVKKKLSSPNEKFMCKIVEVIENHISEEDFNIEQFSFEIGMSRVQLYRKLKALTGKPASLYVRSVRLAKAKLKIKEKEGNISEIAYSVGFGSPTYFTRCFKEEFGYLPSDLV